MKKLLMMVIAAAGAMVLSAQMPRSEWHAKVGDCALDPATLKATIAQLSSEDKAAFVAEVNAAIEKMPGSDEVKAAKFLAANRAAIAGAGANDRAAVLAEIYATVPPEALTVINEEFAKNEFSRPPNIDDDDYTNIVAQTMTAIAQRTSTAESGGVRAAFAGLMFIRAAGSAADATSAIVVSSLPNDVQADAQGSWLPSALGQGQAPSYDAMLAPAQAGDEPDHAVVVSLSPAQTIDSMLLDLQAGGLPSSSSPAVSGNTATTIATSGAGTDGAVTGLSSVPRDRVLNPSVPLSSITGNPADRETVVPNPYYGGKERGGSGGGTVTPVIIPTPTPTPTPEPVPYWLQGL